MEGYPDIRTVDYWLDGDEKERFPQSRINCSHNKAVSLTEQVLRKSTHAFPVDAAGWFRATVS